MNFTTGKKRNKNFGLCSKCLKKGEKNPFYNKKHSEETIDRIIKSSNLSEKRKKYYEKIKSIEHREFLSKWMKENPPMKGKSFYTIWIEKYGVELADKMKKEVNQKMGHKGSKNYWYGKTPPYGSGNGWSGWYKGWYFRSLLELSYMIKIIEKFNLKWENGELCKFQIKYNHNNDVKNYFPDFIIENKYMVECKPKRLWNTELVKNKTNAAKEFCKENNLIYKLRDIPKLTDSEILFLFEKGDIVWIDRYKKKFENRLTKFYHH